MIADTGSRSLLTLHWQVVRLMGPSLRGIEIGGDHRHDHMVRYKTGGHKGDGLECQLDIRAWSTSNLDSIEDVARIVSSFEAPSRGLLFPTFVSILLVELLDILQRTHVL